MFNFIGNLLGFSADGLPLLARFQRMNWAIIGLLCLLGLVGCLMLYSAGGMSLEPWSGRHLIRFLFCLCIIFFVALIDIRFWHQFAYLIFFVILASLVFVELAGYGSGSQRWIRILGFSIQPSEFMKVGIILALARYFNGISYEQGSNLFYLLFPLAMILSAVGLIVIQPDLGTALMVFMVSGLIFWIVGVHWRWFFLAIVGAAVAIPLAWQEFLYDYQRQRLLVFLNPDEDPLGQGYHILQSKIALGSGGFFGKGWGQGSQSLLEFLPEKHTDFIFTMIAEEFGFFGTIVVLLIYVLLILQGFIMGFRCRSEFCRVVVFGVSILMVLFLLVNTAMVSGLLPVVGVPLPFISYGGSVMLALSFGYGLVLSSGVHDDRRLPCMGDRRF